MKKILLSLIMLSVVLPMVPQAQTVSFDGIRRLRIKNTGPIIKDHEIKGYFLLYYLDKVSKGQHSYLLRITDENLNELSKKTITMNNYTQLYEASYSGNNLLLKFYDTKERVVSYKQYDNTGEATGDLKLPALSKENARYFGASLQAAQGSDESDPNSMFAIPGVGFVDYHTVKRGKMGYNIKFISDGDLDKNWTYKSSEADKKHQTATFLGGNREIVLSSIMRKEGSRNLADYVLGLDAETGKKIFEKEVTSSKYELNMVNGFVDEKSVTNILGLYYPKGSKTAKAKSMGLFAMQLDESGKEIDTKYISWSKDVGQFLSVDAKGKIDKEGYIYFHKIMRTSDNRIYAIGEQFKKAASAAGIAGALLGGSNTALVKMQIRDFVIFEFTESFELKNVEVVEKGQTGVELPQGAGVGNINLLASYLKALGHFDFQFAQLSKDKSEVSIGYMDYEKLKGQKNQCVFGSINLSGGEISRDKIELGCRSRAWVQPAKPGHVLISQYFRKDKRLEMRLEQLNF